MNLFSKAEECFADVHASYGEVKFHWQDFPHIAKEELLKQRIAFEEYYAAAEAAILAAQCGVGEGKGELI